MAQLPSISHSLISLLQQGAASLNRAADQFNSQAPPPADFSDLPPQSTLVPPDDSTQPDSLTISDSAYAQYAQATQDSQDTQDTQRDPSISSPDSLKDASSLDPLIHGVTDLLQAKMQTGAAAALLRADMDHRRQVLDLLK